MNPFYFGPGGRLFGIHSEPLANAIATRAVLICAPVGQEYIRTHRALVRLSQELAQRGAHALRFDYRGCGDSWGRFESHEPHEWIEDIACAFDEMIAGTGAAETTIVGLRFGALLAALCVQSARRADCLVLWEPVLQGESFLGDLRSAHRDFLDGLWVDPEAVADEGQSLGFRYPASLRDQIARLRLKGTVQQAFGVRRVLVVAQKADGVSLEPTQFGASSLDSCNVRNLGFWERRHAGNDKGLIPLDGIAAIARWIAP